MSNLLSSENLLMVDVAVGILCIILLSVTLYYKWKTSHDLNITIAEARQETREARERDHDETKALLEAILDVAQGARNNRVDTAHAVASVKEQIADVPEKTAAKIAEKLPGSSDRDWRGREHERDKP